MTEQPFQGMKERKSRKIDKPKPRKVQRPKAAENKPLDKEIVKRAAEIKRESARLSTAKGRLKKMLEAQELTSEGGLTTPKDIDMLPEIAKQEVEKQDVIWQPYPGPQTEFLKCMEDEVLFSGGRGSGKSDCLIVDPLRYCNNKNFRGLVIRRTMPELRELISRAKNIYPQAYKGAKWKEKENSFVFPSGAQIDFGYCDKEDDVERYRGQQYTWLGVDEISQYPSQSILEKLKGSLRTTDPSLSVFVRATTNPTGSGRQWVKERWIDKDPEGGNRVEECVEVEGFGEMKITRKWFNSTVRDNPALLENNPHYLAQLASLPETLRRQWLYGDWDAADGLAFPEFRNDVHVVKPFKVPNNWYKFRACDWGFSSMAVCLWFAVDYDNNIFVYREYATSHETADVFANNIKQREANEYIKVGYLDGSVWAKRGEMGETVADTMMRMGLNWVPSDRSPGSRKSGKAIVHKFLRLSDTFDEITGEATVKPKLFIFDTCKEIIKELGTLMLDPNDAEDIDKSKKTSIPDHAYDALRYGLMTRPDVNFPDDPFVNNNSAGRDILPPPVDSVFGY